MHSLVFIDLSVGFNMMHGGRSTIGDSYVLFHYDYLSHEIGLEKVNSCTPVKLLLIPCIVVLLYNYRNCHVFVMSY